jgi:hypothetical protein
MKQKILVGLVAILVIIQFIRPDQNVSGENSKDIRNKYAVPQEVDKLLAVACNDCHSNKTSYPWYANIQPVGWWMSMHVKDGKRHLNLSEYLSRPIAFQNHKFEEIMEMTEEKEMPLPSYTWLGMHPEANLTDSQRKTIMDWAQAQMDTLQAQYPPDSLIMKRRSPTPSQ